MGATDTILYQNIAIARKKFLFKFHIYDTIRHESDGNPFRGISVPINQPAQVCRNPRNFTYFVPLMNCLGLFLVGVPTVIYKTVGIIVDYDTLTPRPSFPLDGSFLHKQWRNL